MATADSITFRVDGETRAALRLLTRACHANQSAVIRRAVLDAARRVEAEQLRQEAAIIANNDADRAEMTAVQNELADLRAW